MHLSAFQWIAKQCAACWRFALIALLSSLALTVHAQAPNIQTAAFQLPSLFADNKILVLEQPLGVLVAPKTPALSPAQLLQSPLAEQFKVWQTGMLLPTSDQQDVWLRLSLPKQSRPQSWLLRIPRLTLHKATLFQLMPDQLGVWQTQVSGIHVPSSAWPVRSRDPIFEISTRSDATQVLFVRLENNVPVTENIQLIHSSDFGNAANYAGALNGLIMGVFAMLTLISLISWRIYHNSHFGWFALFSISMMFSQLNASGHLFFRVWPHSVYLAKTMGWVLPFLSLMALARLALSVSYARDLSALIYRGLWSLIALSGLICAALLIWPEIVPREPLNFIFAAGMFCVLGAMAWIAWHSQRWLWLVVLSLIPVVLSVLARLAYNLALFAHMEVALLMGVLTSALGLLCVYGALIYHQSLRLASSLQEDAMETKDVPTGLFNERIARARLPQIITRSKRFGKPCGVILLRWIGFNAVMAKSNTVERGRIFAHLGNRLSRLARDIDTVARFGDDQFIVLVEAPVSHEQLSALASKILTTCLRPSNVLPDQKGFDLHMALWLSDQVAADASQALELLKTRISQMREGTQRRVQFINANLSTNPGTAASDGITAEKLIAKINALEATQSLPTIRTTPVLPNKENGL